MSELFSNKEVVLINENASKAEIIDVQTYSGLGTLYYLVELENGFNHHIASADQLTKIDTAS